MPVFHPVMLGGLRATIWKLFWRAISREGVTMTSADEPDPGQRPTPRQEQILQCIRDSRRDRGYAPTQREIAQAVGLASPSSVSYHLAELARKGYLSRGRGRPRTIAEVGAGHGDGPPAADDVPATAAAAVTGPAVPGPADTGPADTGPAGRARPGADPDSQVRVPLVGRIAAGTPITAQQEVEDTFLLPRKFVGHGTFFMLKVAGDSMINAGISDGDYVVIRQQEEVTSGDIVAALLDGIEPEATIKTFQRAEDGQYWLMPHNPAYPPIPGGKAEIMGRVVTVLRVV
jgi:repressor LexA